VIVQLEITCLATSSSAVAAAPKDWEAGDVSIEL
jgi:hypothetical protein